ncbi:MAG: hypothetical protein AAF438_19765, partial [Pseudomonadota bacterium]
MALIDRDNLSGPSVGGRDLNMVLEHRAGNWVVKHFNKLGDDHGLEKLSKAELIQKILHLNNVQGLALEDVCSTQDQTIRNLRAELRDHEELLRSTRKHLSLVNGAFQPYPDV